jgi:methylenetetrahydrofolate reductase (NADPH)
MGFNAAPHLSIGADSQADVFATLDAYEAAGVRRIVALRGDLPSGTGRSRFVHAETLVRWIREHSGDQFHVEVAAYPETHPDGQSPEEDLRYFAEKVAAGANSAITQYFYNPYAYYDFMERCARAGIDIPVVPGIMPITNFEGILRFSDNCGADVPRWLRKRMEPLKDDESALRDLGIEVVTRLCEDLLAQGAPGLHFYTLNRWGASLAICRNLGLPVTAASDR